MKKAILLLALILCITIAYSQPTKISYQGVLTDNSGALINGTKNLTFKVYDASTAGNLLATDVHNSISIANGLFNVELNIGSVNFAQNLWLEITVENTVLTPRIAFNASGYALASKAYSLQITTNAGLGKVLTSDANGNGNWTTHVLVPNGTISGQLLYWNGTAWVTVATGNYGQILEFRDGFPTWTDKNVNSLNIGDTYKGGIVAYILQPGDPGYDANVRHGLIAAPSDQSTGAEWGCYGTTITGADGSAIGTGAQNTIDIENDCTTAGTAADICANLVLNGYSDWYLPSSGELNKLYLNKSAIGGFTSGYYWSSTEDRDTHSWIHYFDSGVQNDYLKNLQNCVRAIRSF